MLEKDALKGIIYLAVFGGAVLSGLAVAALAAFVSLPFALWFHDLSILQMPAVVGGAIGMALVLGKVRWGS